MDTILIIVMALPSILDGQKMCSRISNFQPLVPSSHLSGYTFESKTGLGFLQCIDECNRRRRCMSVNYNSVVGLCELNEMASASLAESEDFVYSDIVDWTGKLSGVCSNHSCPTNSVCKDVSGEAVCDVIYCDISLANKGLNVDLDSEHSGLYMEGETVTYSCPNYNKATEFVCGHQGVWHGEMKCKRLSINCKSVKACNSSAEDGYFWIFSANTGGIPIKVFCSFITLSSTKTFLKLEEEYNFSDYPGEGVCDETSNFCGKTRFRNVILYLSSFEIGSKQGNDDTINSCDYDYSRFGWAGSCSEGPQCEENTGSFIINTTGTGFIVDPSLTWTNANVTRQNENRVVVGQCHGDCVLCHPDVEDDYKRVHLVIDPKFQPVFSTAALLDCSSGGK